MHFCTMCKQTQRCKSFSCNTFTKVPLTFCLVPFTETFTVHDALESFGFGKFQWKMSFLTGLSWVRILKNKLRKVLPLTFSCRRSCRSLALWEQLGDAMEMMILSILGPQLLCEWRLSSYQVALLTSVKSLWVLYFFGKCHSTSLVPWNVW